MTLEKVIQRIEIEMSAGQNSIWCLQNREIGQQDMSKPYYWIMGNHTRSRRDPASQLSSENQIDTGYIHRVNSRTML